MKELKKAQMGIIAILTVMLVSMKRRLPEARRFSSGITTLTLAGIVLLVAAGSVSADMPINSLPFTADTADTVYYLADNLTCTAGEAGITITASNVTIDGRGKNITGNVESCSCANIYGFDPGETFPSKHSGIYNAAQSDLTVKDLEIIGFCTGIVLGSQDVTGNTITGCNIHHNGKAEMVTQGIHGVGLIGNTITKCEIHHITGGPIDDCGGGGNGIFFYGGTTLSWGNYNNVTCNYLHDNDKSGFFMKKKCQHCDISYNRATGNLEGGIVPKCKKSNENTITYNNVSGNTIYGIQTCGSSNTIEYNTAHDNQYGIWIGASADMGGHGKNNVITNNSACGNSVNDVFISQNEWGYTNTVDDVTCDTGNNATYCDDWSCDTKVPVYFDFDEDVHYSSASCTCDNTLCSGACCNPGLFNESHANMLNGTNPAICWRTAGDDPNDCLAYTATGDLFESDGITPLTGATATMKNLKTGVQWNAVVEGNTYTVKVDPVLDISAGNMLRITAKNVSDAEGWTDHKVNTCDIALEGFTADVIIDNYILNYYPCYPYYIQEEDNWSGPAVMKACIAHYINPPSQAVLNETGIGNNHPDHPDLLHVDPRGMEKTMDSYLHPTGHNYGVFALSTAEDALHRICYWQKLGPGAVPAYGDYSNWMAVGGIRTNKTPTDYSAPYDYDVHGFWVNDPKDPGGIGENTYKTATEFTNTYYVPTVDNEVPAWDNKYMSVLEPPEQDAEVRIVPARTRFASPVEPVVTEVTLEVDDTRRPVLEMEIKDDDLLKIVKAAINGVNEDLVPYDAEFASVFADTVAGKPMFVAGDNDYCIVPFDLPAKEKIEKFDVKNTLVVVLVDAEDGSFKEASWVADPVKYLPISDSEALKLVFDEKASISKTRPMIELVYRGASPYYPDWMITIGNDVYFVSHDGTVSQK